MDLVPYRHARDLRADAGEGDVALDLGGGTGRVARLLGDSFRRLVVVDVERAMLARARGRGLACVQADAARLPFRDGVADLACAVDAFHHFPDQDAALREARRVLAQGGRLVVEEFDPATAAGRAIAFVERLARFGSRFHAPEALAARLAASGFAVERRPRAGRRDYALRGVRA